MAAHHHAPPWYRAAAGRGAAHLVGKQARRVQRARRRLDASDPESLHDFRVALRRLRSLLRTYRGVLGDRVPRRTRRTLRAVAHATNLRRDIDVQLAWIEREMRTLSPKELAGARWLRDRLASSGDTAGHQIRKQTGRKFRRVLRRLRRRLREHAARTPTKPSGQEPTLPAATSLLARHLGQELVQRLHTVHREEQQTALHQARIAAKHLRYLLEPFKKVSPPAERAGIATLLDELTTLQDVLGDIHDAATLSQYIARALTARALVARPGDADRLIGLRALSERLRQRGHHSYAIAEQRWLGAHALHLNVSIGVPPEPTPPRG